MNHCAYCDRPIPPDRPSADFCAEHHQRKWHEERLGLRAPGDRREVVDTWRRMTDAA